MANALNFKLFKAPKTLINRKSFLKSLLQHNGYFVDIKKTSRIKQILKVKILYIYTGNI